MQPVEQLLLLLPLQLPKCQGALGAAMQLHLLVLFLLQSQLF